MSRIRQLLAIVLLVFCFTLTVEAATEIAITVDDLPGHKQDHGDVVKTVQTMLAAFKKHHLTGVYGMLNGGRIDGDTRKEEVLRLWVAAGNKLGNHTWSHADLAKLPLPDYIREIAKNEDALREYYSGDFHFFRYPFLAEGNTEEKREGVRDYLRDHGYKIAQVTVDFFDIDWIPPYQRCLAINDQKRVAWVRQSYLDNAVDAIKVANALASETMHRPMKHILLVHLAQIEADTMDDLLSRYEKAGVRFIALDDAVADPTYDIDTKSLVDRPYTFLNQVRRLKGLPNPKEVQRIYDELPEEQLDKLCR